VTGCALLAAAAAVAWALLLRRRLRLAARAEHELRGPLAALRLATDALARRGATAAPLLDAQVARMEAGIDDLAAARGGRPARAGDAAPFALQGLVRGCAEGWAQVARRSGREVRVDWRAGPVVMNGGRRRLAQALGNLLANALEHGRGRVEVRGERAGGVVRIQVSDEGRGLQRGRTEAGRGQGLGIAARAAEREGGRLALVHEAERTTLALELPDGEPA
jgi:signal transduction histidine kinase